MEINGTRPACLVEVLNFCPKTGSRPHVLRKLLPSACSPSASLRLSGIGSGGLGKWNRREGCWENICLVGHHCGQLGWKLPGSSREQFEYTSDREHLSPGSWPVGKGLLQEGINALTCPDCTCVSTRSILAGVPVYVGASPVAELAHLPYIPTSQIYSTIEKRNTLNSELYILSSCNFWHSYLEGDDCCENQHRTADHGCFFLNLDSPVLSLTTFSPPLSCVQFLHFYLS